MVAKGAGTYIALEIKVKLKRYMCLQIFILFQFFICHVGFDDSCKGGIDQRNYQGQPCMLALELAITKTTDIRTKTAKL